VAISGNQKAAADGRCVVAPQNRRRPEESEGRKPAMGHSVVRASTGLRKPTLAKALLLHLICEPTAIHAAVVAASAASNVEVAGWKSAPAQDSALSSFPVHDIRSTHVSTMQSADADSDKAARRLSETLPPSVPPLSAPPPSAPPRGATSSRTVLYILIPVNICLFYFIRRLCKVACRSKNPPGAAARNGDGWDASERRGASAYRPTGARNHSGGQVGGIPIATPVTVVTGHVIDAVVVDAVPDAPVPESKHGAVDNVG
jgi:hypothetical protein